VEGVGSSIVPSAVGEGELGEGGELGVAAVDWRVLFGFFESSDMSFEG